MKILHIIDIPWNSGVTNYAMELSKGLSQKGHKIFFAGVENGLPLQIAKENGYEVIEICTRKNPFVVSSVLRLSKLIKKEKIDIVNAHTGKGHFLAYITSLVSKKNFSIIRTKSDVMFPKKSFLYKKTAKIIAASEFIRKRYLNIGIEPGKVITIYQGIESRVHEFTSSRVHEFKVGIVGRLDPVKGHRYFLEAAEIVLSKFPETKFLVAGKEENIKYEELKKFSVKLGLQKSVEFLGFVSDVSDFMSKCTLGVLASTSSEAVSRVLLEWMTCEKPVIATSVGCIPEILGNDFLVPPNNSEALAEKIISLLKDTQKMQSIGKINGGKIKEKFNFDRFISETEKVFYEAIDNTSH
ncbi:MAG: glycosyltransferase family 4 protein [Elusimicrobiota bacterium]